jgi:hypothetical protein
MASIFAPDCTYLNPRAKRVLHDPEEIAGFYAELHDKDQVELVARISLWFEECNRSAFEIESTGIGHADMRLAGVDIVTLDGEGLACRFAAFPFGATEFWD